MIRSMTAYARKGATFPFGNFVFEIHSVNRKQLDINFTLPKEMVFLEMEMRSLLSEKIQRGRVTIRLFQQGSSESASPLFDLARLKRIKSEAERVARELGFDPKIEIDLRFLMGQLQNEQAPIHDEESFKEPLLNLLSETVTLFLAMREKEGGALLADIDGNMAQVMEQLTFIEKSEAHSPAKFREKLEQRLAEFKGISKDLDYRILQEVALLADKASVAEEIARLHSHCDQFKGLLASGKPGVGRTLEFLAQEMLRETSTIAAKTADSEASLATVMIRSALDKVREQVLNVE